MILTNEEMQGASLISKTDADIRLKEFKKFWTIESKEKNYDFDKMKEVWPEGTYFNFGNVEGWHGEIKGKFLIMTRGADSLLDWLMCLLFSKKTIPYEGTNEKIKVHNGFIADYKKIRNFVHDLVRGTDKDIIVYGQSKGATLATFAALDIQYNFPDKKIGSFTSGSPKVGNKAFKESFEKRLPDHRRFDYGSDLITQIPPKFFGYEDVGLFTHFGPKRRKGIGTKSDHDWNKYNNSFNTELK